MIADLAAVQFGVVSRAQLVSVGVSPSAIKRRLMSGRLVALYPCVYAAGHAVLRREGHFLAAVLACGPGAVLSHQSAAAHWGLRPTSRARVDVSGARHRKGTKGIDLHRPRRLDPKDVTTHDNIPVTSVARTLLDLAEVVPRAVPKALEQAEILRLLDAKALDDVLARGRAGAAPGRWPTPGRRTRPSRT